MHYKWLLSIVNEGWMKFMGAFKVKDRCKKCNNEFTHIWLDGLNKKTYLMCMECRNEWLYYHRRRITKEKPDDKACLD